MDLVSGLAVTRGLLHVRGQDDTIVLALEGPLDEASGELLVAAVTSSPACDTARLEIDLGGITSYDDAGAGALCRCRQLADQLPCPLTYRAGSRLGRELLLATLRPADG